MTWTLEQHIIDAAPAAVRKSGSFTVDREGIVAAVRAAL